MASPNLGLRKRKKAHTRQRLTYVYPEMAAALEAEREPKRQTRPPPRAPSSLFIRVRKADTCTNSTHLARIVLAPMIRLMADVEGPPANFLARPALPPSSHAHKTEAQEQCRGEFGDRGVEGDEVHRKSEPQTR